MKFLFALVCLLPLAASAGQTQTLTCEARELAAGGQGKIGQISISITKLSEDKNDPSIDLTVGWSDGKITGPGLSCGEEVARDVECKSTVGFPGRTSYQISSVCGDRNRRADFYFYDSMTNIVLSNDRGHGRLSCRTDGGQRLAIELRNCQ